MIAGVEVKVDGQALAPEVVAQLTEVKVDDHLNLPDTFVIRVDDPGLRLMDSINLEVGKEVEISFQSPDETRLVSLLKGQITSVEPEFTRSGASITARGYDHSHQMNREKRSEMFQNATIGDVARRVAQRVGVSLGQIDDAGGPQDFIQQNNETDWEFLGRLARRIGNEALVSDGTLHFRAAGQAQGAQEATLRYGENLLSFKPRITGVQQTEQVVVRGWDRVSKRVIEATARPEGLMNQIGVARDALVSALNGGTLQVADRPVASQEEADALARSIANRVGNGYVEAEGLCTGDPRVRAGSKVKIEGVGQRYGGTYTVSRTRHLFRGSRGYETQFFVTGQQERSLVELLTPAKTKRWGNSVVIGVVSDNDDPEKLGRVRVKFPEIHDTVSPWAQVAALGAGQDRGQVMVPQVDDTVVVALVHDDIHHPIVLGTLWNANEKPGTMVDEPNGSYWVKSDHDFTVEAKEKGRLKLDEELVIEVGQAKVTVKKDGTIEIEGQTLKLNGKQSVSIEGGPGGVKVQAQGTVQVSGSQVMLG